MRGDWRSSCDVPLAVDLSELRTHAATPPTMCSRIGAKDGSISSVVLHFWPLQCYFAGLCSEF